MRALKLLGLYIVRPLAGMDVQIPVAAFVHICMELILLLVHVVDLRSSCDVHAYPHSWMHAGVHVSSESCMSKVLVVVVEKTFAAFTGDVVKCMREYRRVQPAHQRDGTSHARIRVRFSCRLVCTCTLDP